MPETIAAGGFNIPSHHAAPAVQIGLGRRSSGWNNFAWRTGIRYVAVVDTSDAERVVDIYTDGACSGNPGPGGWGAILRYGDHEKEMYGGEPGATTNNRMELTAPIRALESLTRPSVVHLHTDSTYVRNGITAWLPRWKRGGWLTVGKQPVKNADLWQRLDAAAARHRVHWYWVKGHAGHPENERADRLAVKGLREAVARDRGVDSGTGR
jgi:ribonuclease HI